MAKTTARKKYNLKKAMSTYSLYSSERDEGVKATYKEALENALAPLQAELDSVQGRCTARCCNAYDIVENLRYIQTKLGIKKVELEGTKVFCSPYAGTFDYDYPAPRGTTYRAEFRAGHWTVSNVLHEQLPFNAHANNLEFSHRAQEAILKKTSRLNF